MTNTDNKPAEPIRTIHDQIIHEKQKLPAPERGVFLFADEKGACGLHLRGGTTLLEAYAVIGLLYRRLQHQLEP